MEIGNKKAFGRLNMQNDMTHSTRKVHELKLECQMRLMQVAQLPGGWKGANFSIIKSFLLEGVSLPNNSSILNPVLVRTRT